MRLLIPIFVLLMFIIGCNNDDITDTGHVKFSFSTDTIAFDTVFTAIGSTSRILTLQNPTSKDVTISSIRTGSNNSFFKLNIDGFSANILNNIEIPAHDSIYIFVQVNIDPQDKNNPVFIEDSIIVENNNGSQSVLLHAFGQDVHFIRSAILENTTWVAGKPYFVTDSVSILPNSTLKIEKGVTVYCYKSARFEVYGNIEIDGTPEEPVVFRGHRLDSVMTQWGYDKTTSQWSGIYIYPSELKNKISNCIIRNAEIGLYFGEYDNSTEQVKIDVRNTIIHNNSYAGIYAVNAIANFINCQITNSGYYNLFIFAGGSYQFQHCTIANFFGNETGTKRQKFENLVLTNAVIDGDYIIYNPLKKASFTNCIIDGNLENELKMQFIDNVESDFLFTNCAIKAHESYLVDFPNRFVDCYFNEEIKYRAVERWNYDFRPDTASFVIDKGTPSIFTLSPITRFDLLGVSRLTDNKPDIGAYEFILEQEPEVELFKHINPR